MKRLKLLQLSLVSLLTVAMMSCSTAKRSPLPYFSDIDAVTGGIPINNVPIKIEPSDELFITVTSKSPEATMQYNLPLSNPATTSELGATSQPRQQTYIVDSKGNIQFPVLGTLHVAGLTIEQLQDELARRISADVEQPIVKVELVNFKVSVGGEVKEPGQIEVPNRRISVLDALAAAGDLTEYAERSNVLVIREEDGVRTYNRLNLNSAECLTSPYFYLKQNDYVYVTPNKIRQDNSKYNQNNAFKLSVISTIVSGCSVVASLIIALTTR